MKKEKQEKHPKTATNNQWSNSNVEKMKDDKREPRNGPGGE